MKHALPFLAVLASSVVALAGDNDKKTIAPTELEPAQPWRFSLGSPGWIPWEVGKAGINGTTSNIKLGPNDIIPKIDMIASLRAEAHKGKFSIMGEYIYLGVSDGVGATGLVKKLDVRLDQHIAELAFAWRLAEGQRGWVDVYAGVRYTNLYQSVTIHPDNGAIDDASRRVVDTLADRIAQGVRDRLVPLIQQRVEDRLSALQNRDPVLPDGPIADALRGAAAERVRAIVDRRRSELDGAIKSGIQARIDAAKSKLAGEIASALKDKLDTQVARTDDWWDPFIGLRGRYYMSKSVYLLGRADIGGFGVGSQLAWQVNAGVGCQLSRSIYAETTYRAYHVNYRNDGLVYDVLTHGPEITLGIQF